MTAPTATISTTTPMTATSALPTIYAIRWSSDWAGDVPAPFILRAYLEQAAAEADPDLGKRTYDGVSARTQGSYELVAFEPSSRLRTLHGMGASFGLSESGEPGAWINGAPAAAAFNYDGDRWTWKREEAEYILASYAARNPRGWAAIFA